MTRRPRLLALAACLATSTWGAVAFAQDPSRVGVIDFYGLRHMQAAALRGKVAVQVGDQLSVDADSPPTSFVATERQLAATPGVASAKISGIVCCADGAWILYIHVRESGVRVMRFRPAPHGDARLPAEVTAAGSAFSAALWATVPGANADTGEDDTAGHALNHDPRMRDVQLRFVQLADAHLPQLREVLRDGADAGERALAAHVLGYVTDKAGVVPDLTRAMSDPSAEVRNNAMRALLVFTKMTPSAGRAAPRVSYQPFIALLGSPEWSDRNKSSAAIESLSVGRDPRLLKAVRKKSLAPLSEMARWQVPGHAVFAFKILGRLAGLSEDDIERAWQGKDHQSVIRAALDANRYSKR